jgi:hypothetical protein
MRAAWLAVAVLAALAGCGAPQPPQTSLNAAATRLDADPVRAAIRGAADAFAYPETLQNRPQEAATAVSQLEFIAVEIMAGRTSLDFSGIVGPALQSGRFEVRNYLGIAQNAQPQSVIDALLATPPYLGDPSIFTLGPAETLRRLSAMPRLPQANSATAVARQQMEFGPPEFPDL